MAAATGRAETDGRFSAWEFRPEVDSWQPLDLASVSDFSPDWLSVVAVQTHLYILGSPPAGGDAPHAGPPRPAQYPVYPPDVAQPGGDLPGGATSDG